MAAPFWPFLPLEASLAVWSCQRGRPFPFEGGILLPFCGLPSALPDGASPRLPRGHPDSQTADGRCVRGGDHFHTPLSAAWLSCRTCRANGHLLGGVGDGQRGDLRRFAKLGAPHASATRWAGTHIDPVACMDKAWRSSE